MSLHLFCPKVYISENDRQGSIAYDLFAKIRKQYLKLETVYKDLKEAYKEPEVKYKKGCNRLRHRWRLD